MVRAALITCAIAGLMAGTTHARAQDNFDIETSAKVTGVAGYSEAEDALDGDLDADIKVVGSTVFENGLEVGVGASARLDGQAPARGLAGGRISGPMSGGDRGFGDDTGDAAVDQAYIYAFGGLGRLAIGREIGVGDKFAVTSPNIFTSVAVNGWRTDLTRLIDIHTINDFSSTAAKFSYIAPQGVLGGAIGRLSFGLSYTPSTDVCGEEYCFTGPGAVTLVGGDPANAIPADANWEEILEYALYYEKAFGDFSFGLGASYLTAEEQSGVLSDVFDDYEAYSIGLNLAFGGFTLGGSVKNTNGGYADTQEDGYLAFDAGVTYETGGWGFMFGYGNSDAGHEISNPLDLTLFRQTEAYQTGVTFAFDSGVTLGAAAQFVESEKPDLAGGEEEAAAIVLESSIRF
ncbi:MAG: porin [Pseudomonadota bacterium]